MNLQTDPREKLSKKYLAARQFIRTVDASCREAGIEPRQYELLVVVSEWSGSKPPTVRKISEKLAIRHNTTVELIDRTEARGAIARTRDAADRRQVFIEITPAGEQIVALVAERIQDAAQELNGAASERDETHDATAAPTETGVAMSA